MRKFFICITICLSMAAQAQNVGVGTSSPAAKLDISSTNSGILIPRVALSSTATASPVTSPVTSMMVYNSATAGSGATAVTPGFYYWSGSAWIRVIDNGSLGSATTNTLANPTNTITSTVNGVAATAPAVNTVSNSSSGNTMSTTVNGVAGTGVNIVNSNTLTLSGTTLTSSVNGLASSGLDISSVDKNIYNSDGTLTGTRTVTQGSNNLYFSGTGNIGMGTVSPNGKLSVVGKAVIGDNSLTNNDANDNLYLERVGSYTQMHLYNNDGSNADINAYISENTTGSGSGFGNSNPGLNIWTSSAHPIRLATNQLERVTILSGGNVGIGNTNPAYKLHVYSTTSGDGIMMDGSTSVAFLLGASGTSKGALGYAASAGAWSTDAAAGDVVLRSSASQKLLFNTNAGSGASTMAVNGANVGIGTTAPNTTLAVNGQTSIWNNNKLYIYSDAGVTGRGYWGPGRNTDMTLLQSTSNWMRISNPSQIAFWTNGNGATDDYPQAYINASGVLGGSGLIVGVVNSGGTTTAGTQINNLQAGNTAIPTLSGCSGGGCVQTVTISYNFPSGVTPNIICTVQSQSGTSYSDVYATQVKSKTNTSAVINVCRTDAYYNGEGWGQNATLSWMAWY
jgi:hypothetical protein